jgi:hypothetical protein
MYLLGFYDIAICEKYSKLDMDFKSLKDLNENCLNYLNVQFVKLSEFSRDIDEFENWLSEYDNTLSVNKSNVDDLDDDLVHLDLNNLTENFKISGRIEMFKMKIVSLEKIYGDFDASNTDGLKLKFKHLSNNFVRSKLNELQARLNLIDEYMNRKFERNLFKLKDFYQNKIKIIKNTLDFQVNLVTSGNLITLHQYENAINTIKEEKSNLDRLKREMHDKYKQFERDEKCVIRFESMSDLNEHYLTNTGSNSIDELLKNSTQTIFKWKQFDNHVGNFDCEFNRIHSNLIDLDLYLTNMENGKHSGLCQRVELARCQDKLNDNFVAIKFDRLNDMLIDMDNGIQFVYDTCVNPNTKTQLARSLELVRSKYKSLLKFNESIRLRSSEFFARHKAFIDLTEATRRVVAESRDMLAASPTNDLQQSSDNVLRLKTLLDKSNRIEAELRSIVDRCSTTTIHTSMHVENLFGLVNECECELTALRGQQTRLVELLNEKRYRIKAKLVDIEHFLNYIRHKYDACMDKIDFTSNSRVIQNFDQYIGFLLDMHTNWTKLISTKNELDSLGDQLKQQQSIDDHDRDIDDEIELLTRLNDAISPYLEHIEFVRSCNYLDMLQEFNDVIKKILRFDEDPRSVIGTSQPFNDADDLKYLFNRFNSLKANILVRLNDEHPIIYLNKRKYLDLIENCEWKFNEILLNSQTQREKIANYRTLAIDIETRLQNIEDKLRLTDDNQYQLIVIDDCNFDFKKFEEQFAVYVKLKDSLQCDVLRKSLNFFYELECDLERMRRYSGQLPIDEQLLKDLDALPVYETLRVKQTHLTGRLDNKLKELESEFANWKYIAKKSRRLLDLITFNYKQLKQITDKHKSFKQYRIIENQKELLNIINKLKYEVLESLYKNSYMKNEVLDLVKKVNIKSRNMQSLVEKIISNWTGLIDKVKKQIHKYESLNKKINNLDVNLTKLDGKITILETYLKRDFYKDLHLESINSKQITKKQMELKNFLKCLHKQNAYVVGLLDYTKMNLCNGDMVQSLGDRWSGLKTIINNKHIELENLFASMQDLQEQIEKCHVVLNKTETLFLSNLHENNLKYINNLYAIINDDYELIKCLNKSYMNAMKTFGESIFNENNVFKEKVYAVNKRWDYLHNEVAVKIKAVKFNFISFLLLYALI